jgi:hypothetical protein
MSKPSPLDSVYAAIRYAPPDVRDAAHHELGEALSSLMEQTLEALEAHQVAVSRRGLPLESAVRMLKEAELHDLRFVCDMVLAQHGIKCQCVQCRHIIPWIDKRK